MRVFFLTLFFSLFFSACVQTEPKSTIATITDKCVLSDFSIKDIKGIKQSDGFMKSQIIGKNESNSYKQLEYKIVWLDKNGFVIKSILSNWRKVSADANQPFYITNTSPSTKADDFRIYIRQNNKEVVCEHQ
jgi:uncharacterized protein YcfL